MNRFVHMMVLAAFLAVGVGVPLSFATEPAPAEQKEKKDSMGSKLYADEEKKADKKDMGGKAEDDKKKDEKKDMGGR